MLSKIKNYTSKFYNFKTILIIYIACALFASSQSILLGTKKLDNVKQEFTHYNNYVIFKNSYFHLLENKNLYAHYLDEQWDLFKYSPTFSLLFGGFAYLPDYLGLFLWNSLNSLVLLFGIWNISIKNSIKLPILFFIPIEMLTSLQNAQSNALIAGLIILAFALMEKEKLFLATFLIVISIYIKLFGIVALCLLLLFPNKIKSILYTGFWMLFLFILPLIIVSPSELLNQYSEWWKLLKMDHTNLYNYSIMYWLESWFGIKIDKIYIALFGVIVFLISFGKVLLKPVLENRLMILSSVLIWVIIFNHKAESPTFVIAFAGLAIWYFIQEKNKTNLVLIISGFILTGMSATDFFPKFIRINFFQPYVIKVFPCILIWFKLNYDLILNKINYKALKK